MQVFLFSHIAFDSGVDLLPASRFSQRSGSPFPSEPHRPHLLTLRALLSKKDAEIITAKDGQGLVNLCDQIGAKAEVSKKVPRVHERVLTIEGSVENVAEVRPYKPLRCYNLCNLTPLQKAYMLIAAWLVQTVTSSSTVSSTANAHTSLRFLISHNLMGAIIGHRGRRMKAIQDGSGAHLVALEQTLPQSTERPVDVQGSPESIGRAIEEMGKLLLDDWKKGLDTIFYNPVVTDEPLQSESEGSRYGSSSAGHDDRREKGKRDRSRRKKGKRKGKRRSGDSNTDAPDPTPSSPTTDKTDNLFTQTISIPCDMIGCIIGHGGSKINEIRRLSRSKITIAREPHDETKERMVTIIGTPEANEKALFLLYCELESEKESRH
jgi:heterogeneous nuclear rnp K-like protein